MTVEIPDDLTVDIRQQKITLSSGGKKVTIDNGPRHGVFANGPMKWSVLLARYIAPALWQFREAGAE